MKGFVTTTEAGKRLGISDRRVRHLIKSRRIVAESIGGTYLIAEAELKKVSVRKPGRPKLFPKR